MPTDVLAQLRTALAATERSFVRFLNTHRVTAQDAIDYRSLEQQILRGGLDLATLDAWRADYARFVQAQLAPLLSQVAQSAGEPVLQSFLDRQAFRLASTLTANQAQAIRLLVQQGALTGQSVRELAQFLRPLVGLTTQQARAVQRFAATLRANGVRESTIARRALLMSHRLQRIRVRTIARTELAVAHAAGAEARARARGGNFRRIWRTAEDERVCDECNSLDGTVVTNTFPPAHPNCRCAIDYLLW